MKKYISTILALTAIFALNSCQNQLDIPQHGVSSLETYYSTDEEVEQGTNAIYLEARGLGMNYILGKNMLTDDFWAGGAARGDNSDLEQLNEFNFGVDQSYLQGMFEAYYKIVYKANVIIGRAAADTDVKQRCIAEAKVFRAWAYFELISMWGNPPLVDHELLPEEYSRPNGTDEELWGLVEKDLTEAIASGFLPEKASADDNSTWRLTKQFAQAVLGKAYLWQKKYKEAATAFDEVVNSGKYRLFDLGYENILSYNHKHNCESLCEFNRIKDDNNPNDNFDMTYVMIGWRVEKMDITDPNVHPDNGWGFVVPQKNLYDAFVAEEGYEGYRLVGTLKTVDQLREMGATIKPGETMISEGIFNWKLRYEPDAFGDWVGMINHQNLRIMRYAEVLLCAAEAHLQAGNQGKANEYLNMVRSRARLADKTATLEAIQLEKRLELCAEGVRYQDIIRWGLGETLLANQGEKCPLLDSNGQVTWNKYNSTYGFKAKHNRLPYPGTEMRLNTAIKQNPGW